MVLDKLTIKYGETTEEITVKRIKFRARSRSLDQVKKHLKDKPDEANEINTTFAMQAVVDCVCDNEGKPLYTLDDLDEWHPLKLSAYCNAIAKYQNPSLEDAGKNSSTTPSSTS